MIKENIDIGICTRQPDGTNGGTPRCIFTRLHGNLQIDGQKTNWDGLGAMGFGQKVVEIMIDIDFFKDSKVYVYLLTKLTIITLPCCILFYLHHLKMSNNWCFYNKSRIAQIMR